ncbi:MAG: hypothetical protein ACRERE_25985 [Candidatus Entotheonellia bacterium]
MKAATQFVNALPVQTRNYRPFQNELQRQNLAENTDVPFPQQ